MSTQMLANAPSPVLTTAAAYEIDASHSGAHFRVRHLMVANVRGELGRITGQVVIDDDDLARSSVQATIDATTINTRDEKRDAHLRSADFLDVERWPAITFRSTRVAPRRDGGLDVTGDLTIRDVTRQVVLDVEPLAPEVKDPRGNVKRGATATATIDRKDFGIRWNAALEAGGVLVGDQVSITLDIELVRQA